MPGSTKNPPPHNEDTLELVEQAMKQVAAQPETDFALLAKLDRLRGQVLRALRRGGAR